MAAFLFPPSPDDGEVITNPETGTKYIYQQQYNKWMVALKEPQENFVDLAGYETMTGPLAIEPAAAITGNPAEATLHIQASPFKNLGSSPDSNFVSQIFRATDVNGRSIVTLTNSDADNLPILQGKRSALRIYAAETLVGITGNQYEIPDSGAEVGFAITGPTPTNVSSSAKVLTSFYTNDGSGSSVRYYGKQQIENDLATIGYVANYVDNNIPSDKFLDLTGGTMTGPILFDESSGDAINVNEGKWKLAYNGVVNQQGGLSVNSGNITVGSGNITVKSTSGTTGRIYVKNGDTTNITIYPDGSIESAAKLTFSGTSNNIIRAYGSATKTLQFKVSDDVTAPVYTDVFSISKQFFTVEGGTNAGTNTSNTVGFVKKRGNDSSDDFVIEGATADAPTVATGSLFQVHRNQLNDATNPDAVNYYGRVIGDNNIQTKTSVNDLIQDALDNQTSPANADFTSVTVTSKLAGSANGDGGNLEIYSNSVDINAGGRLTLPNYINASSAPTPTIQLLSGSDALIFRSDIKVGLSDTVGRIGYIGQGGLAMYKPYYVFGGGIAGSDNPDASGQDNQISFNNVTSEYAIFQSKGYSQNGYQVFADTSSGTPKKIMNWLLSADGTKGYINCYYEPETSYGLVRKMDLTTNTVTAVNTYSQTGTPGTDSYYVTALNHDIQGQCTFQGLQNGGSGFQLIGKTTDQPTNWSARLLTTYHFDANQAAQVEYFGDTVGTDNCLQTKASVEAILAGHAPDKDNSTAYGTLSVVKGEDGSSSQFRIRNDANNGDTFKVNHDGSVNAYGGFYSFIGDHENATIRNTSTTNANTTISFDTKKNGGTATQCIITSDDFQIKRDLSVAQSALVYGDITSMAGQVIAANDLVSTNSTGGGGIQLYSAATVSGITAWGAANKTFKVFTGQTKGTDTKQMLAISQVEYQFGNSNLDVPFTFSSNSAPTQFEFTQSLAMRFNDMVNPLNFSQGYIKNLNGIDTATDATQFLAQCIGGTNQKFKFNGTTSSGNTVTVAEFTPTNAYILDELDIYKNSSGNGRIYSYGYSRGLEIWAADYKTSKGNSVLTSKFEAGMLSIMTDYITWDNKSARPNNPYQDLYLRLGVYGEDSQYPKINFQWATATGVASGMTMEYTDYKKVPNVTLNTDANVTAHAAPTTGDHLCNKTYVDNKTVSLQNTIHSAVNSSTDFASLKAALLAALA